MVFGTGSTATTDAVLCAAITWSFACFASALFEGWNARNALGLVVALAAAQLVKGPVGVAVPLLGMLPALFVLRRELPNARTLALGVCGAALAATALFVAWGLPANAATEGRYLAQGLGHHVVDRMADPMEGHGAKPFGFFYYYELVVVLGALPWLPLLPGAVLALFRGTLLERRMRVLLATWIVTTMLLMSAVATKLPHYALPLFPALALAVAALADHGAFAPRARRIGKIAYVALVSLLALGFVVVGVALAPTLALRVACGGAALIAAAGACFVARAGPSARKTSWTAIAAAIALHAWIAFVALPAAEELKLAPRLALQLRAKTADDVSVTTYKFDEPSLIFYMQRTPVARVSKDDELAAWFEDVTPGVLVAPRDDMAKFAARTGATLPDELASVEGFNYSKGRWMVLAAWSRATTTK